jgi:hypothetical protein
MGFVKITSTASLEKATPNSGMAMPDELKQSRDDEADAEEHGEPEEEDREKTVKVNPILDVRREPDETELPTTELAAPALDAKGHSEPDQARPNEVSDVHGMPDSDCKKFLRQRKLILLSTQRSFPFLQEVPERLHWATVEA